MLVRRCAIAVAFTSIVVKSTFGGYQLTTLASFAGSDGSNPAGGLLLSGNTLYGTTQLGGAYGGWGTVFSLPANGGAITTLGSFGTTTAVGGVSPEAGLVRSGDNLYGTLSATLQPGSNVADGNLGNIFSIPISGGNPVNLETFASHLSLGP